MSEEKQKSYRVLARKYRPQGFDQLIGQDALVRTLKNAIESGRVAHAFILTGIRGTGKTTTARIIAKALNYKGPDGKSAPTTGPTEDCQICQAITEDRHPDVMEMDAASRTGVDDIREILDGVRYAPTSARYKVYIIDEIHMLSKSAFNALLKTLEEPPEHVIFIFATTEIRKVPVTVLSRCQRFDLRRVDAETLADYYKELCGKEEVGFEDEAIKLIARAADGSVRDGLSLLDQAIALSNGEITTVQLQDMLGLADRNIVLNALEGAISGSCETALEILADLYKKGADPLVVLQDMLDFTHLMTRMKAAPKSGGTYAAIADTTRERLESLSSKLSMPSLGRAWQILLKGLGEVQQSPNPQSAAEMILIRLAYASDLPDPAAILKRLQSSAENNIAGSSEASNEKSGSDKSATASAGRSPAENGGSVSAAAAPSSLSEQAHASPAPPQQASQADDTPETEMAALPTLQPLPSSSGGAECNLSHTAANDAGTYGGQATALKPLEVFPDPDIDNIDEYPLHSLRDVEFFLRKKGHMILAGQIFQYAHEVNFEKGRLELRTEEQASSSLLTDLSKALSELTQERWFVSSSKETGSPTLAEQRMAAQDVALDKAKQHSVVKDVLRTFPGATIELKEELKEKN